MITDNCAVCQLLIFQLTFFLLLIHNMITMMWRLKFHDDDDDDPSPPLHVISKSLDPWANSGGVSIPGLFDHRTNRSGWLSILLWDFPEKHIRKGTIWIPIRTMAIHFSELIIFCNSFSLTFNITFNGGADDFHNAVWWCIRGGDFEFLLILVQ